MDEQFNEENCIDTLRILSGDVEVDKKFIHFIMLIWETKAGAAYPLYRREFTLQTKERRVLLMYVTYPELIQIGIFIVALVALCYRIFKK